MEPEVRQPPIRYGEIDLLRFLAALAVVLFHFTFRGFQADHLSPVEYPVLGSIFKYGYFGVDLFFLISGYVVLLSAQGKTLGQFFTSRVTRLYPAYWVACTFTFVVVRLFGPAPHTLGWSPILTAPLRGYLFNMTMLHRFFGVADFDGVYWTLNIELVFYFLVALLISFQWLKHLTLVLAVWLAYCAFIGPVDNGSPFAFLLFPRVAPFFIAGMAFYLLQTSQAARWKLYVLLLVAYLSCLRAARADLHQLVPMYQYPFSLLVTLLLVTLFFGVFLLIVQRRLRLRPAPWITWVGALTYPIYLLHHNVGYVTFQRLGGHVNKYVLLTGMLATVLVLAYLLHTLVERRFSKVLGGQVRALLA
ncbi:MAG: acyltransferase family protein [Janthinobacterium lividum]